MIRKIFHKKIKTSDEDKHLIRMLRLSIEVTENQHKLNLITTEEYSNILKSTLRKVIALEEKYGVRNV